MGAAGKGSHIQGRSRVQERRCGEMGTPWPLVLSLDGCLAAMGWGGSIVPLQGWRSEPREEREDQRKFQEQPALPSRSEPEVSGGLGTLGHAGMLSPAAASTLRGRKQLTARLQMGACDRPPLSPPLASIRTPNSSTGPTAGSEFVPRNRQARGGIGSSRNETGTSIWPLCLVPEHMGKDAKNCWFLMLYSLTPGELESGRPSSESQPYT